MKIPGIFYDPDNPVSLYVWGVGPPSPGRRVCAGMRVALPVTVLFLLLAWSSGLSERAYGGDADVRNVDLPMFLSVPAFVVQILISLAGQIRRAGAAEVRGAMHRDLRPTHLPGAGLLHGWSGPRLLGLCIASGVLVAIILAAIAWSQHHLALIPHERLSRAYAPGSLPGINLLVAARITGTVLAVLAAHFLDLALWFRGFPILARWALCLALILSSPVHAGFAVGAISSILPDAGPAFDALNRIGFVVFLEVLSWPVRGWIVRRVWQSAIRTLDEDDVP